MAARNLLKIFILLLIVAVAGVFYVKPAAQAMHLGLDLQGGVYVVLEAKDTATHTVTDQDMTQLVSVIRERVDKLGVSEPTIERQGKKRIIVSMPGVKQAEEAINLIGQTAQLEFLTEDGKVILTGKDLKKAQAGMGSNSTPVVSLQFSNEGAQKFADATAANVGKRIAITLDGKVISAPVVQEAIPNGQAQIDHMGSADEAQNLAVLLNSGSLPVGINILETRTVGPTLGKDSIQASEKAAAVGIVLVLLYMLVYYRLPGLLADIALGIYIVLVMGVFAGINVTLTLPGIAGLILSVGMAVDANVIIFERMKEELQLGKSLRAAIDSGFSRAFITIVDSNITTLIAAGVLFYFGSGPIKGFAVTLSVGVLASMFTAIVLTKFMLKAMAQTGWFRDSWLFRCGFGIGSKVQGGERA